MRDFFQCVANGGGDQIFLVILSCLENIVPLQGRPVTFRVVFEKVSASSLHINNVCHSPKGRKYGNSMVEVRFFFYKVVPRRL